MDSWSIDPRKWAEQQFGECKLGNKRRTERLIAVAANVAGNPSGSFPEQMGLWKDLKAAYRLFDIPDVTFQAILEPHWRHTRDCAPGRYLVIGDTTELDFGLSRQVPGLSRIGNGTGLGFLLHSGLMVGADSEEIFGLAAQTIHYRKPAPKNEKRSDMLARERESVVWGQVIDATGQPPTGAQFVHVLDRGGDNFEVYAHVLGQHADWVVRANHLSRKFLTPSREKTSLKCYISQLPVAGTYALQLRARPQQAARTATLEVRFGALSMLPPKHQSPYVKSHPAPIAMPVVWVREINAPKGVEPIEWVLLTSLPVNNFEDAWQVISYYEKRWLIEEWHKALKTGCHVTERQLKTTQRLEAMVGLMSVEAVRLLQLKSLARSEPNRPAREVVPPLWIDVLAAASKQSFARPITVRDFYRAIAKLGGFIGRKSDGEPGWITIWRGWEKLHLLIQGSELIVRARTNRQKLG